MQKGRGGKSPTKIPTGTEKASTGKDDEIKGTTESGTQGEGAGSNNGKAGFRGISNASRSFMHKRMTRDSLAPKYPDSERGESWQRASFLVENTQSTDDRSRLNNLTELGLFPSVGDRSFTKTPRATLPVENSDGDYSSNEKENKKAGSTDKEDGIKETSNRKKLNLFNTVFFSKHRNKR